MLPFSRWKAPVHDSHMASPLTGQRVPEVPTPFGQTHCLVSHLRSLVPVGAADSYWCTWHTECLWHLSSERKRWPPSQDEHLCPLWTVHWAEMPVCAVPLSHVHTFSSQRPFAK